MPLSTAGARAPRRHRVAIALALPFVAAVSEGCSSLRAAARAPDARDVQSGAPASFVRSTSDARSTRLIDLRDGLTNRKSTRLNSSHGYISYAVFCLKKKNKSNIKSS